MPDLDLVAMALLAGAVLTTTALAALSRLRQRRRPVPVRSATLSSNAD